MEIINCDNVTATVVGDSTRERVYKGHLDMKKHEFITLRIMRTIIKRMIDHICDRLNTGSKQYMHPHCTHFWNCVLNFPEQQMEQPYTVHLRHLQSQFAIRFKVCDEFL